MSATSRLPLFALTAVTAALAALNWSADPSNALVWAGAIVLVLAVMAANAFAMNGTSDTARQRDRTLRGSLMMGLGLIALALGFAYATEMGLGEGLDKRATLVGIGLILVFTGNMLPKTVLPLAARGRNPARQAAAERFAGRVFVLCGLGFALCALFTPLAWVTITTGICGLVAFAAAMSACFWVSRGTSQTLQED